MSHRNKWWQNVINKIPQDLTNTPDIEWNPEVVKYAIWKLEKGANTGHLHVQVFMETWSTTIKEVRSESILAPKGWALHCTKCDGNTILEKAIAYIEKEETSMGIVKEWGVRPKQVAGSGQGTRNDLKVYFEAAKTKRSLQSVLIENSENFGTFVKYHRGLNEAFKLMRAPIKEIPIRDNIEVIFHYGKTNLGKTYKALKENPDYYKKTINTDSTNWFDNYMGQKTLIIDEFTGWFIPAVFLQILDVYPLQVGVKGSHDYAEWTKVVITSNILPENWWAKEVFQKHTGLLDAVTRRISKFVYFKSREEQMEFSTYQDLKDHLEPVTTTVFETSW